MVQLRIFGLLGLAIFTRLLPPTLRLKITAPAFAYHGTERISYILLPPEQIGSKFHLTRCQFVQFVSLDTMLTSVSFRT